MAYDAARDRIVLYSGVDVDGEPLTDTWEWDGITWSERSPMFYDPRRERVVYQARVHPGWAGGDRWQLWEYDGHRWRELTRFTPPVPEDRLCTGYHAALQAPVIGDRQGDLWLLTWR